MLKKSDKIMHLHFNVDACPVQLMDQNQSAHALFCLNSLTEVIYSK